MAATEAELDEKNQAPQIDLNGESEGTDGRLRYVGNSPVMAIAPAAFAYDDSEDFEGGRLIVEFTERSAGEDQLQIVGRAGEATVYAVDKDLYFGDLLIGSIAGGTEGNPLLIEFHSKTTSGIIQAVVRSIGYANLSKEPAEGERFVAFTLVDREGEASRAGAKIEILPGVAPEIDLNGKDEGTGTRIKYVENEPAVAIAPEALVFDDQEDFEGGRLVVEFADGGTADDRLQIAAGPNGESAVYAIEGDLYFRDSIIGSISGGTDGSDPLLIVFHSKVTAELVQAVVRSIGYANFSQDPVEGKRFVTFTLFDREGAAGRAGAGIYVVPVDTPAVAVDDTITTTEDKIGTGSLFDANGPGNDYDPDSPRLSIAAVNGSAADVGQTVILKSGAKLTVNEDGTYQYDPNGQFDWLTDNSSGAVNSFAIDTFEYTLADGGTATVTMIVTGVAGVEDKLMGDESANMIMGMERSDRFMLQQGGEDIALGAGGNDVIYVGSELSAGDVIDGGEGRDAIVLQGNVAIVLSDWNLVDIESISIQSGANSSFGDTANNYYDYSVTTADGNVAPGVQLIVNAQSLRPGEDFTFDGSLESDGRFLVYGGHGVDNLTGGAGNDVFFFEGRRWGSGDRVVGGAGRDSMVISAGSGIAHIEFGADSIAGIESISLNNHFASDPTQKPSYELVLHNGNVEPGGTLIVNGSSIATAAQFVNVDGSAVRDGKLMLFGGAGNDSLTGGGGADLLFSAGGADDLRGGAGSDTFRYDNASDSTASAADEILDFQSGLDRIDLGRIDADSGAGGDQAFTWIGAAAFSGTAGELRVSAANGLQRIEGDTDGDGLADLVILLQPGAAPLGQGDFQL